MDGRGYHITWLTVALCFTYLLASFSAATTTTRVAANTTTQRATTTRTPMNTTTRLSTTTNAPVTTATAFQETTGATDVTGGTGGTTTSPSSLTFIQLLTIVCLSVALGIVLLILIGCCIYVCGHQSDHSKLMALQSSSAANAYSTQGQTVIPAKQGIYKDTPFWGTQYAVQENMQQPQPNQGERRPDNYGYDPFGAPGNVFGGGYPKRYS